MLCPQAALLSALIVISLVGLGPFVGNHVAAAPPLAPQKTANLSELINETLKINNKSDNLATGQSFREEWTFDRVEYDLMDFLQELNSRYSQSNYSHSPSDQDPPRLSSTDELSGKNCASSDKHEADNLGDQNSSTSIAKLEIPSDVKGTVATTTSPHKDPNNGTEPSSTDQDSVKKVAPHEPKAPSITQAKESEEVSSPRTYASSTMASISSPLPISLASGDHDISESSWQYGIFDRFTRPRSSTTPHPADTLAVAGSGTSLEVKGLNSDECGLRSYRVDPDRFPQGDLDNDEIAKELSQRRQRPPPSSSFFSSHKKYHHTATGDPILDHNDEPSIRDLLDREKLLPPFDRYGDRVTNEPPSIAESSQFYKEQNYSSIGKYPYGDGGGDGSNSDSISGSADGSAMSNADHEFNLSSRRQWLQQQLGNTLQLLGFNSTSQLAADIINNQTGNALSSRENMMKISSKLGKSLPPSPVGASVLGLDKVAISKPINPELTEKEPSARQDDLKLEARVIGGNDARLGDSPWSVSLQALVSRPGTGGVEYRHYCGGTIISEYYILTAAHCLDFMVGRESRLFVVIGDLNWKMSAASMYGRRFGIEKLIIHGGYKSTAFGHDIGLIKTKESMKPLKVNGRYIINSVCLPERNVEHSGEAELVGWGLFSNRNEMADSLQIADVPILPRPLCVDLYRRRTGLIQWLIGIELITEKQVCAGTFGRGICQGDSGSALVFNEKVSLEPKASSMRLKTHLLRDNNQRATIIGIVAFGGIRRCSYQSLPGVYMQTSKYLDWILPRIQS